MQSASDETVESIGGSRSRPTPRRGRGPGVQDRGSTATISQSLTRLLIGRSPVIVALRREIARIASAPIRSLLVLGETGVGKDLVAKGLLLHAPRLAGHLEVFNCPAIPIDHLESELFGTTRGAYPGAVDRPGAVERARGGLLMLDEVGAMSLAHQSKLLRLLESGETRRLGARNGERIDLAFVAATNEDLHAAIHAGRFRADLYYRLVQDAVVRVPPLRERREDIESLASHFLGELPGALCLSPAALERLHEHAWPGNVRELRAVLRTASRLASGRCLEAAAVEESIQRIAGPVAADPRCVADASPRRSGLTSTPPGQDTPDFHAATRSLRRRLLQDALRAAGGNRTEAGVRLGLHRRRERRALEEAGSQAVAVGAPTAGERRLAQRKFDYWWRRLGGCESS